jgi:hypothetical protein
MITSEFFWLKKSIEKIEKENNTNNNQDNYVYCHLKILLITSHMLEHMPMLPGIIRRKSEERPNHPYQAPQDIRGSAISHVLYTFFYIVGNRK